MYYVGQSKITQQEVSESSDHDFPVEFLALNKMFLVLTNEESTGQGAFIRPGKHELDLDESGYLFCSRSKGDIKSAFNSSRILTVFKTSGAQIALLSYSYNASNEFKANHPRPPKKKKINQPFKIWNFSPIAIVKGAYHKYKDSFKLSGHAVIVARADWFGPLAQHTKLIGDTNVSGKTIANFIL